MKASELTLVFVSVSMFAAGLAIGRHSAEEPVAPPEPVGFVLNMPEGQPINAPLIQMDCDRDPEVTVSGANILMMESGAPAINVESGGDDDK
jgi:hypothetical protein